VSLEIWSAKVSCSDKFAFLRVPSDNTYQGQRTHTISIPVSKENPSLGLALQLAPLSASQNIWHVLSIPSPLSPAHLAGLIEHSDYILGSPSGTLRGESALGELVEDHLNRSLVLWVYNSEFDVVREVELVPKRGWGGEGALGAVLGYGALHRLPVGLGEEVEGPGEVVFETRDDGYEQQKEPVPNGSDPPPLTGSFLVPANIASPPPLSSPATTFGAPAPTRSSAKSGRRNRHAGASPSRAFDEYFAESEQKSKEQDFAPARKSTPLAPPPKAGDPAASSSRPASADADNDAPTSQT
jgi:hypothetical protein